MPAVRSGVGGRRWTGLAVFGGYALVAFLYLGVRLLVDSGSQYLGFGADPKAFIWCFGWWPYAILHGQNPFVSAAIWAPHGVNLIWTASVPALALAFAPLTLVVGPVVSYNVAAVLVPAFVAWSAYALCRHLTGAVWPAIVGGYLFGFSAYVFGQEEGHPNIAAVFPVPLVALACVRFVRGEIGRRGLVLRLAPLFGLEFLISTEVAFTLALAIGAALVLGVWLLPRYRRRLVEMIAPLAGGAAFAALLTAPFLYYAVTGFDTTPFHPPTNYVADALNYVIPTRNSLLSLGWAGSIANTFPGNDSERDAYIGIPALLIVGLFAWRRARTPTGRFLLAALVLAFMCSLGFRLTVDGRKTIWLPWSAFGNWPLFDNVLTERLSMYATLVVAVIVALWTASRRPGLGRWLLPGLAMVAIIPNPAAGVWATRYSVPAFFTDSAYRPCLASAGTVLVLPPANESLSMLWQVSDDFRFRQSSGNIAANPPSIFLAPFWIARVAEGYPVPQSQVVDFTTYIRIEHVTNVVVDPYEAHKWAAALNRIATPHFLGGILYYHVSDAHSSCPGVA